MTPNIFRRVLATLIITILAIPHAALAAQSDVVNAVNQIRLSDPNVPVGTPNPRGLVGNIIDNMFYPTGPKEGKIRPEYLDVSLNWSLTDLSSAGDSGYIPKYTGTGTALGNSVISESAGSIGIGTAIPTQKLDVAGLVRSAGPIWQNGFLMNGQGSATAWRIGACDTVGDSNCSPNSLVIHQDTVGTRLSIDSTGNIGIGTIIPSYTLDVVGTINTSALRLPNGSGSGKVLTSDASGLVSWQDAPASWGGEGSPIGTVAAFDLAACPVGWSPANGTAGTPDLRGEFIRGLDSGRGVDVGRVKGSWQVDEFKSHSHDQYAIVNEYGWWSAQIYADYSGNWYTTNPSTRNKTTSTTGGAETRPRNVALLYCIKTSAPTISSNTTWTLSGSGGDVIQASVGNVGIGTVTPSYKLDVVGTINASALRLPNGASNWLVLTSDTSGLTSWQATQYPCISGGTGSNNTCYGASALPTNTSGSSNTAIWKQALLSNTVGSNNTANGTNALFWSTGGSNNTAIGANSAYNNIFRNNNTTIGTNAGYSNISGDDTVAVGTNALYSNNSSGNIAIGYSAGSTLVNGTQNIFIGYNVQPNISTIASNQLNIGNWIYGDNGNIGIGTATPSYKLDVVGTINASALRLPNGSGSGRVLTSDASGNTSWQDLTTGDGAPIGTVTAFNLSVCPAGWSPANGTSGTPDLRGEFIRGLDSGRGVDTGRTLGTAQTDELKSHSHALSSDTARFPGPTNIFMAGDGTAGGTTGGTTQSAGGAETRPRNVALLYCIKTSAIAIAGSTGWSLTGNAGTTAGTNFIGTTDNVDLVFKQNSLEVWRIRDTSNGNVSIGHYTLSSATGIRNAAVGFMALWKNTTGTQNTAMGTSALQETTTGVNNTAFGNQALGYNITGSNTTAVGHGALWQNLASDNTAIGSQALTNNTTGVNNTAVGRLALAWNTTGVSNTANGHGALRANTTGTNNSANGTSALMSNTTGSFNTANGAWALQNSTTWDKNTANGFYALLLNTTGLGNTAHGESALGSNTTWNFNTAVGLQALVWNTTGTNNIAIGYNAQVPSGTADNQVRIGDTAVTYAGVQVAWSVTSDIRWKDKVRDIPYGLSFLKDLRPVDYIRKNNIWGTRETGFIAQEVEQALIKNNYTDQGLLTKSDAGYLELRYNDFIAMLVRAVQEISGSIDTLTARSDVHDTAISELQMSNKKLQSENAALMQRLDAIEKQLQK